MDTWVCDGRRTGKVVSFQARVSHRSEADRAGYIGCGSGSRIPFFGRHAEFAFDQLTFGAIVTFDLWVEQQTGQREARAVRLLDEETEQSLLRRDVESPEPRIWRPVLARYVALAPPEEAVAVLRLKWPQLSAHEQPSLVERLRSRAPSIFVRSPDGRALLDAEAHFTTCLNLLAENLPAAEHDALLVEIVAVIEESGAEALWTKVPEAYLDAFPVLRTSLPPALHLRYLMRHLPSEPDAALDSHLWTELRDRVAWCAERWLSLPRIQHEAIRHALPSLILAQLGEARRLLDAEQHVAVCCELLARELSESERTALLEELADTLSSGPEEVWDRVPREILESNPRLRRELPPGRRVRYLVRRLRQTQDVAERQELLAELRESLKRHPEWSAVPNDIAVAESLWPIVPVARKIDILITRLADQDAPSGDEDMTQLVAILSHQPRQAIDALLPRLPAWVRDDRRLLRFLTHQQQVESVWPLLLAGDTSWWAWLSWQARILCIYRAAQEDQACGLLDRIDDEHPLAAATLGLLRVRVNPSLSREMFQRAHMLIQDLVVAEAWTSTVPLDLSPLLPPCAPAHIAVAHCEGRVWPTRGANASDQKQAQRAYCPRARVACWTADGQLPPSVSQPYLPLRGARLYADPTLRWWEWSLQELVAHLDITPAVPKLKDPQEYVSRLSGWVNRLNEIRERLACRPCGAIMKTNMKYAKHLAVYASTVFSCEHGAGHDQDVYLSHCWACREVIDGRDCRVYVEGYRVCLACGSGPQASHTYRQGSLCPKCESKDMHALDGYGRRLRCGVCQHTIKLPPADRLTGPPLVRQPTTSTSAPDEAYYFNHVDIEQFYYPNEFDLEQGHHHDEMDHAS